MSTRHKKAVTSFVETPLAQSLIECLEDALRDGLFIVAYGNAGTGKTTAILEFLNRHNNQVKKGLGDSNIPVRPQIAFITANPTTTPRALVTQICERVQISAVGSTGELLNRLTGERFDKPPRLIIVDDSSFLTVSCLETLRFIYDAGCGLVLVGVRHLMQRLLTARGRTAEELVQFTSRIDRHLTLPGSEQDDLIAIGRANGIQDDTLKLLVPHAKRGRDLLKLAARFEELRRLNPRGNPAELLNRARQTTFRAA